MSGEIFRSRLGIGLGLGIWGLILLIFFAINGGRLLSSNMFLTLLEIAILLVAGTVWFGTRYLIKGEILIIKIGPFTHSKIALGSISSIHRSFSADSSPASSLKRIRLTLLDGDSVLLSPHRELEFIQALKEANPKIYNGIRQKPPDNLMVSLLSWLL